MSASSAAVIAAIAAQRKKLIGYFVSAGAVTPENAVAPESLPHVGFRMLERLKADRVICVTPQGNLYLDQSRATQLQAERQATAVKIIVAVVVLTGLAAAATFFLVGAAA